jgi:hypothetical protein
VGVQGLALSHVHFQEGHGGLEIGVVKLVGDAESEGSKLPPLLHN